MSGSYIQPQMLAPAAPPWNWNPGETFVTAMNEAQLTKQKSEQMAIDNELNKALFPAKMAMAAFNLDKMEFDLKRVKEFYEDKRRQQKIVEAGGGVATPESLGQTNFPWSPRPSNPTIPTPDSSPDQEPEELAP